MKHIQAFLGLVAGGALCGCGGSPSISSGGVDRDYGVVSTRAVGGVQEPVTTSSSAVTVSGVFGANFLGVSVNLPPETQLNEESLLGTTMLAYSVVGRPMLHEYGSGLQVPLNPQIPAFSNSCVPTFSGTGDQLCTSEYDNDVGFFQLFTYNADGSARTRITNLAAWALYPSWSPTSTKIAYVMNNNIMSVNRDGTGLTTLTTAPENETLPKWHPSGTKIYYFKWNGSAWTLWEMTSSGTGQAPTLITVQGLIAWDFDPSGNEIVVQYNQSGTYYIVRRNITTGTLQTVLSTTDQLNGVTWSPTGSHIAYARDGVSPRIESVRLRDGQVQFVRSITSTFSDGSPEWGPLIRKRSFVAASGTLGTNAAGFLYSMSYGNFASLLAFDATTRNTVDIDVPPPSGFSQYNLIATVTAADSITMLRYANGINVPRVTVVDPANSSTWVQGAIVAFDGMSGKVSSVVPFNRSRSGEKPSRVDANGTISFRGDFTGVFDAEGRKVRESASEVVFDAKSGNLVEAR